MACFIFLNLARRYENYPFFDIFVPHKYWELPNYTEEEAPRIRRHFQEMRRVPIEYRSFLGWTHVPYEGDTLTINEKGDRAIPVSEDDNSISANSATVRFFGGSVTWGFGLEDEDTIPAIFQKNNPQYQVYNHGELSFNSRQNLERLIHLTAIKEEVDIVIFIDGVNEILSQENPNIEVPGHAFEVAIREKTNREILNFSDSYGEAASILFYRYIFDTIQLFFTPPHQQDVPVNNPGFNQEKVDQIAYNLLVNWRIAREITEHEGGRFFAILQPHLHTGSPRFDHLEEHYHHIMTPYYRAVYEEIYRLMDKYEYDWIIDMTDIFDIDEYIYTDGFHFSRRGSEIMSARIGDMIHQNMSSDSFDNDNPEAINH